MNTVALFAGMPGGAEGLIVVATIIVLMVAPKQLPKLARGMGESLKELRNAKKEFKAELEEAERVVKE